MHHTTIAFSNVSFSYANKKSVFDRINFTFEAGQLYLIQGLSGAGKSTLLRLINRLEEPDSGEILFHGDPIHTLSAPQLRRSILYIQQTPVVTRASVLDNLMLPFTYAVNKSMEKPDKDRVSELMKLMSLDEVKLSYNAQGLSVGQQQRLCFIRGLLLNPEVVLLDEPTSALDPVSSDIVENCAQALCLEDKKTVIMVSHKTFASGKIDKINPITLTVSNQSLTVSTDPVTTKTDPETT